MKTNEIPVTAIREAHALLGACLGGLKAIREASEGMARAIDLAAFLMPFRPPKDLDDWAEALALQREVTVHAGEMIASAAVHLASVAGRINQSAGGGEA